jgi:Cu2+-containing amine oxidase
MKIIRLEDAKEWPEYPPLSAEELKEAHALARAAFTADDLQRFTEIDTEETPMEVFIAELEYAQQEHDRKQSP